MNKDLIAIFEYLERERGIKRELVVDAIKKSLEESAQKCVHGANNVQISMHPKTWEIEVLCDKEVVEKVSNPMLQISLKAASAIYSDVALGQIVQVAITPKDFGRVSAQHARQVILQALRGAEKDVIQEEFRHRLNTLVSGTVKRVSRGSCVIVDLGKVEGILPRHNYLPQESFQVGNKVYALLAEVQETDMGGAEVVLTRCSTEFVVQLLNQEVPEIDDNTIVIERIVREAGYKTKIIVRSTDPRVDPVGACIGVRGARIKNIIRELNGERLDVIAYMPTVLDQLVQAFNPIVLRKVELGEDNSAFVVVDDESFPTTIGKNGMNIRLLGQLLGMQITVQKLSDYEKLKGIEQSLLAASDDETLDQPFSSLEGVPTMVVDQLIAEGFSTLRSILLTSPKDLASRLGMSNEMAEKILEQIRKKRA